MAISYKRGLYNYTEDREFQKEVDKTIDKIVKHLNLIESTGNNVNYMGEWVQDNEYYKNDLVVHAGLKYLCIEDILESELSPNLDKDHFIQLSGEPYIVSIEMNNVPETAMQGVLDEEQLHYLLNNEAAYIIFNNEKYYLQDLGHTEGYITYTHLGFENDVFNLKAITITIETRGWVLNTASVQG